MHRAVYVLVAALALSLLLASCAPATQAPAPAAPQQPSALSPTPASSQSPPPAAPPAAAPRVAGTPTPQETVKRGGTLRVIHWAGPDNVSPFGYCPTTCLSAIGPVFSALVRENPLKAGEFVGDLAEKWETSGDGLTYMFRLRPGVKWHDGSPLTADNVAFGIRKQMDGLNRGNELRAEIARVDAPDNTTVIIRTKRPSPLLLPLVGFGWTLIGQKDLVDKGLDLNKTVVGTGPFKNLTVRADVGYTVDRNTDYFLPGRPYLDRIQTTIVPDRATGKAAILTGQVDLAVPQYMQPEWAEELATQQEVILHTFANSNSWGLGASMKNPPFNEMRVFQAAKMAIDMNLLNKVMRAGRGGAYGAVPPQSGGFTPDELKQFPGYRDPAVDKTEAKKLLTEAGFPNGVNVELLHRGGGQYRSMAAFIVDQWKQVGINATLTTTTDAEFLRLLHPAAPKHVLVSPTIPSTPDAYSILRLNYHSEGQLNLLNLTDQRLDDMIERVGSTTDPVRRGALIKETQRYIHEKGYVFNIMWDYYLAVSRKWVRNYMPAGPTSTIYNNRKYDHVWLDK